MPVSKMEESIETHYQASLKTAEDPDGGPYPAYPSGKSWDEVPGQTGSGKKFHRNVISGAVFTADARHVPRELEVMPREWESLNAKAELARMHRDGHCLEAVMWYVHHLLEWVKTLTLCESKADPHWKRATEGRRPKNRSLNGGSLVPPGLATQRDRGLTATASRPEAVGWAPLVGQAR